MSMKMKSFSRKFSKSRDSGISISSNNNVIIDDGSSKPISQAASFIQLESEHIKNIKILINIIKQIYIESGQKDRAQTELHKYININLEKILYFYETILQLHEDIISENDSQDEFQEYFPYLEHLFEMKRFNVYIRACMQCILINNKSLNYYFKKYLKEIVADVKRYDSLIKIVETPHLHLLEIRNFVCCGSGYNRICFMIDETIESINISVDVKGIEDLYQLGIYIPSFGLAIKSGILRAHDSEGSGFTVKIYLLENCVLLTEKLKKEIFIFNINEKSYFPIDDLTVTVEEKNIYLRRKSNKEYYIRLKTHKTNKHSLPVRFWLEKILTTIENSKKNNWTCHLSENNDADCDAKNWCLIKNLTENDNFFEKSIKSVKITEAINLIAIEDHITFMSNLKTNKRDSIVYSPDSSNSDEESYYSAEEELDDVVFRRTSDYSSFIKVDRPFNRSLRIKNLRKSKSFEKKKENSLSVDSNLRLIWKKVMPHLFNLPKEERGKSSMMEHVDEMINTAGDSSKFMWYYVLPNYTFEEITSKTRRKSIIKLDSLDEEE